jgi:hypothetical protein
MRLRAWALVGPATLVGGLLCVSNAQADVSAWGHLGGGAIGWQGGDNDELKASGIMAIDIGMGSSPRSPFIVGGYFKIMPVFDHGVDLGLLARFATQGFQTDMIGIAIDAGLHQRWWGAESTGFIGQVVMGLPLGFQLAGIGMGGSNDTYGFGATLGIDLIRLTVDRRHLLEWWPNPRPNDNMYRSRSDAGITGITF